MFFGLCRMVGMLQAANSSSFPSPTPARDEGSHGEDDPSPMSPHHAAQKDATEEHRTAVLFSLLYEYAQSIRPTANCRPVRFIRLRCWLCFDRMLGQVVRFWEPSLTDTHHQPLPSPAPLSLQLLRQPLASSSPLFSPGQRPSPDPRQSLPANRPRSLNART